MTSIEQETFLPPAGAPMTVETMTFDRLREMNDRITRRATFHVVALVDSGHGSVAVDFVDHDVGPHSAVWITPGAVHRWIDIGELAGEIVLFVPTAPVTPETRELAAAPDLVPAWRVPDDEWPLVDAAREHLRLETGSGRDRYSEVPEILLSALIARLRPTPGREQPTNAVFRAFRASVEEHFRQRHDVGWYARTLGYAPRTLSRAAQQATGRTAKGYLVDRLVLEAQRLLAHDRLSSASCATALGFVDASHFSLFFRNATGVRPGAWQRTMTEG